MNSVTSNAVANIIDKIFESSIVAAYGDDANDFYCGFVRAGDYNCSNLPTARETSSGQLYYTVLTVRENNNPQGTTWLQGFQIAIVTSARSNKMYTRVVNGSNGWSDWNQL